MAIQDHVKHGKPLHVASLDYRSAFDAPDRDEIWKLLKEDGFQLA